MSFSSGWRAWAGVAEAIREQAGKKEIEALCRRSTSSNDDVPGLDALNEMKYLKRPFVAVKLALLSKHISISSVHRSLSVHRPDHIFRLILTFSPSQILRTTRHLVNAIFPLWPLLCLATHSQRSPFLPEQMHSYSHSLPKPSCERAFSRDLKAVITVPLPLYRASAITLSL